MTLTFILFEDSNARLMRRRETNEAVERLLQGASNHFWQEKKLDEQLKCTRHHHNFIYALCPLPDRGVKTVY